MQGSPHPNIQPAGHRSRTLFATSLACLLLACTAASASALPSASTGAATSVTYSGATLHGTVNAHGEPTGYLFEYGPSRKYGSRTPVLSAGTGRHGLTVAQTITGLLPATTYHFRTVAVTATGSTPGGDKAFLTPKVPLSVAITGVPNPVLGGKPFTVTGTLTGTGAANHQVVLQMNPFPYTSGFNTFGFSNVTSTLGGFTFALEGITENAQIRVSTLENPPVTSPVLLESVSLHVTLHVQRTRRRGYARLYGSVEPAQAETVVGIQRLRPGHPSVNVAGTRTNGHSQFSRVVHVTHGLYEALIQVGDGSHVASYSAPVLIR